MLTGVDINVSGWPEIAQLPRFGEGLARRLVETRERIQKERDPARPAFAAVQDLRKVRGIGPKTLLRLRPHIRLSGGDGLH